MLLCDSLLICHVLYYPSMGLSQVRDVSDFSLLGCRFKSHTLHMNVYYLIFAINDTVNARLLFGNIRSFYKLRSLSAAGISKREITHEIALLLTHNLTCLPTHTWNIRGSFSVPVEMPVHRHYGRRIDPTCTHCTTKIKCLEFSQIPHRK